MTCGRAGPYHPPILRDSFPAFAVRSLLAALALTLASCASTPSVAPPTVAHTATLAPAPKPAEQRTADTRSPPEDPITAAEIAADLRRIHATVGTIAQDDEVVLVERLARD